MFTHKIFQEGYKQKGKRNFLLYTLLNLWYFVPYEYITYFKKYIYNNLKIYWLIEEGSLIGNSDE